MENVAGVFLVYWIDANLRLQGLLNFKNRASLKLQNLMLGRYFLLLITHHVARWRYRH